MRVSEAAIKTLQHLGLVELDRKGSVSLFLHWGQNHQAEQTLHTHGWHPSSHVECAHTHTPLYTQSSPLHDIHHCISGERFVFRNSDAQYFRQGGVPRERRQSHNSVHHHHFSQVRTAPGEQVNYFIIHSHQKEKLEKIKQKLIALFLCTKSNISVGDLIHSNVPVVVCSWICV